jgi:hypothetical protein
MAAAVRSSFNRNLKRSNTMRRRILGSMLALNMFLFGGVVMTQSAEAEEGWRDPCCKEDVDGNGFCSTCWFEHDCHSTADCGTQIT